MDLSSAILFYFFRGAKTENFQMNFPAASSSTFLKRDVNCAGYVKPESLINSVFVIIILSRK